MSVLKAVKIEMHIIDFQSKKSRLEKFTIHISTIQ